MGLEQSLSRKRAEYCFESTVLIKKELTEFRCAKLAEFGEKPGEFALAKQIKGLKWLNEFSPRNLVMAKRLTEHGARNRALRNRIRPVSEYLWPESRSPIALTAVIVNE